MRNTGATTERLVQVVNGAVTRALTLPWLGARLGRGMTVIKYVGRRSGREFQIPVSYRRAGDQVTIGVEMPDAKNWWRNFTGDGGPLTIRLDDADHTGHAVATRTSPRRVTVKLDLSQA